MPFNKVMFLLAVVYSILAVPFVFASVTDTITVTKLASVSLGRNGSKSLTFDLPVNAISHSVVAEEHGWTESYFIVSEIIGNTILVTVTDDGSNEYGNSTPGADIGKVIVTFVIEVDGDPPINSSASIDEVGGVGDKINLARKSCPSVYSGEPVNLATGNKFFKEVDFSQLNTHPLQFIRYYNSHREGDRWTHSYSQKLGINATSIVAIHADSQQIRYELINGDWVGPTHVLSELVQDGNNFKVTYTDRHEEIYDQFGQLTEIKYPNGISHSLTYQGNQIVVNRLGEELVIVNDDNDRLEMITTPGGVSYNYSWESIYGINRLINVEYPQSINSQAESSFKIYEYDNEFPSYIVRVTDGADRIYSEVEYDENGRAIRSGLGNGISETKVEYLAGTSRKITNALGKESTMHFVEINGQYVMEHNEGHASTSCVAADQRFTYNTDGLIATTTDKRGIVTSYTYNSRGLVTATTEAAGLPSERVVTTQWHPTLRVPEVISEDGRKTTFTYDTDGKILTAAVEDLAGTRSRVNTYTYNALGLVETIDGPRTDISDVSTYTYDAQGRVATVTNSLGHVTSIPSYNDRAQPLEVVDTNSVKTLFIYHPRGWLLSSTLVDPNLGAANDITTTYDYDTAGSVTLITMPNGEVMSFEYDTAGRLIAMENINGERIEYTLDLAGNRISEKIKADSGDIRKTLTRVFDELSRVKEIYSATRLVARYQYNKNGNVEQVEDGRSYTTDQLFDDLNRPSITTDALTNESSTAYDKLDRVTAVTDQRGLTTNYSYDAFSNVEQLDSPDTGILLFTYDDAGNQLTATDPRGVITSNVYDGLNRLSQTDYSDGAAEAVVYDYDSIAEGNYGKGRLTGLGDEAGYTYFNYDHRGLLVEKTVDISSTIYRWHYGYDNNQNLISLRYPNGRTVRYERDNLGRIAAVYSSSWEGAQERLVASSFNYLPFGGMTQFNYGNGVVQTFDVDDSYRLMGITSQGNNSVMQRAYSYDLSGNVTDISDSLDTLVSQLFNYDPLSRLDDAAGAYGDIDFNYDAVGNRTDKSLVNGGSIVNQTLDYSSTSNQVLAKTLQTFGYDANGNVVVDPSRGLTLSYNQANRLESSSGGTNSADYIHNGFGQRVIKVSTVSSQTTTTHYQYADQAALIFESDETGRSSSEYIFADDLLLATVRVSTASDADSDGLDDDWELQFFGDLIRNGTSDFDGDGFVDSAEFIAGTLPNEVLSTPGLPIDSDHDGLPDTWELSYLSDLASNGFADTDNDGILDRDEYLGGTDPTAISDEDSDGLQDEWEMTHFGNLGQSPTSDFDLDGVNNLGEYLAGTNPTIPDDSDEDGLLDNWELEYFGSLAQGAEGDFDSDGLTNIEEFLSGTDPAVALDSDDDGYPDNIDAFPSDPGEWLDTDMDSFGDNAETTLGLDPNQHEAVWIAPLLFN